jgi:positive regulator of sigma E activity
MHRFWFSATALLMLPMSAYLVWAYARGLISWEALWATESAVIVMGLLYAAIGALFRRHWQRRRNEFAAYEAMLVSLATDDGSFPAS